MTFTTWKCPHCGAIGPIGGGKCTTCRTETTKINLPNATDRDIRNVVLGHGKEA